MFNPSVNLQAEKLAQFAAIGDMFEAKSDSECEVYLALGRTLLEKPPDAWTPDLATAVGCYIGYRMPPAEETAAALIALMPSFVECPLRFYDLIIGWGGVTPEAVRRLPNVPVEVNRVHLRESELYLNKVSTLVAADKTYQHVIKETVIQRRAESAAKAAAEPRA